MKKKNILLFTATTITALLIAAAGISICSMASAQNRIYPGPRLRSATPSDFATGSESGGWNNDNDGIPGNDDETADGAIVDDRESIDEPLKNGNSSAYDPLESAESAESTSEELAEILPSLLLTDYADDIYTLCEYYFPMYDYPIQWIMGNEFDPDMELSDSVDIYLDGPGGHMEDYLSLPVEWDLSQTDFEKEGSYTVTGLLDTSSCEYPVDWDNTPPPSFTIEIIKYGTVSFRPEYTGTTLTLNYEINGRPYLLPYGSIALYESRDDGASWYNISESSRVRIYDDHLTVTGITSDTGAPSSALFQAAEFDDPGFCSDFSDIVEVTAAEEILSADIISSGGLQAGGEWNDDPITDGPYPILEYRTYIPRKQPMYLEFLTGNQSSFEPHDFDTIYVYYGDAPQGFWHKEAVLPVMWDWTPVDGIDWNQEGDTVIHGNFTPDTIEKNEYHLDFDHMPELTLTISIRSQKSPFKLYAKEERPFENKTAQIQFFGKDDAPLSFEYPSALRVWCSIDGDLTWYDITGEPNVSLTGDTLTVSDIKEKYLRAKGYTFQIEQTALPDHEQFSSALNVYHGSMGIYFGEEIGGDRGGGNRQDKPPEGLFDHAGSESGSGEETPPEETPDSEVTQPSDEPAAPDITQPPSDQPGSRPGHSSGGSGNSGSNDITAVKEASATTASSELQYAEEFPFSEDTHYEDTPSEDHNSAGREPESPADPDTPSGSRTEDKNSPAGPGAEADSTSVVSQLPDQNSKYRILRIIAGISAVALGGAAGFYMIRRR